jgi:two-component system sensor histidine kinase PilS (NtrC family)
MTPAALAHDIIAGVSPGERSLGAPTGDDAAWRSLAVFAGYRVALVLSLSLAYAFLNAIFQFGAQQPGFTVPILAAYAFASALLILPALLRKPGLAVQVTVGVAADVAAIVALMHISGGIRSGIGVSLLITLAAAGLITRGRLVFFHAALGSVAILLEQGFQVLRFNAPPADFVAAGFTSMALFATAGLGWTLARYARTSETIARQRGIDLENLSQINEFVIRDMQDGVLVVDTEGAIRQHNPGVTRLLGPLPPGRRPALVEYSPELGHLLELWRIGGQGMQDVQLRSKSLSSELTANFVTIGSGEPPPTVIFVQDVGRLRAQAQQVKLAALGRLTASIAHEIRNPLSSINHAAELLAESEVAPAGDARLVSIIRDNVDRLDRIVTEVLSLARRGRAEPELIDPRAFLRQFAADFCATEKVPPDTVEVDVRTSQGVAFDRQHLHQVLWNLARNAWRHGRKRPGSIRLRLVPAEAANALQFEVVDDGPGIPPAVRQPLFEPFFTTEAHGTGLGLYIARELCEANGAGLEFVEVPAGCCFRITLTGA